MKQEAGKVYFYRVDVEGAEAPFERYRELASLALGGLDLGLPEEGTVLINPNVTMLASADSRIITHPGFVAGILDALIEKGVATERVVVGEGHGHGDREPWARETGYAAGLEPYGLELVDVDESGGVTVEIPGGVVFRQLTFARQVTDCAYYINAPVAKCHNLCCTTLAMKNTQGTVLSPQRHMCGAQKEDEPFADELSQITELGVTLHEERFCHKQADKTVARLQMGIPQLCVVDGLIGRDGTGFREGHNRPMGWTVIGDSEVLVDTVATYLMGLDPEATPYLQVAAQRGVGTNRVQEIEVIDLASSQRLEGQDLSALRSDPALMPMSRVNGQYAPRFREDGSVVPWGV